MHGKIVSCVAGGVALACAQSVVQGPAPAEVLLTTAMSGVLPVLPTATPFAGVETEEGAIIYDGPMNPGFTGQLGDAVVQQNTAGTSYKATLPSENFDPYTGSTVTGSVTATVPSNGTGIMFTLDLSGFPDEATYGPFAYHIHTLAVPADGNCTSTLSHLDPTDRGEYYPCDPTQPQTCQAGDLAGKHGNITTPTSSASFLDLYLSTDPTSQYYFGGKALVIHTANTTRITCANFVQQSSSTTGSNATVSGISSPSATGLAPYNPNGAGSVAVSAGVMGSALLAAFAYLM